MSSSPKIVTTVSAWRELRDKAVAAKRPIAVVPTMGALHAGHLSLVAAARAHAWPSSSGCGAGDGGAALPLILVTIFVNPTQFNEAADFAAYPRELAADAAALAGGAGGAADIVIWAPSVADVYPGDGLDYTVACGGPVAAELEGAARPGHFTGMLSVVLRLLLVAEANAAFFGEKDWQQLALVRGLAAAFHLRTAIVAVPTVREADGLALSSRNARLTADERARAPRFHAALAAARTPAEARTVLAADGFAVEYVEDCWGRRLAAVRLGATRLIDNLALADTAKDT